MLHIVKRYIKRERDGKVYIWDKRTAAKKGFSEITEAEAKWRLGGMKGKAPGSVDANLQNLDEDIVGMMSQFDAVQTEKLRAFCRELKNQPAGVLQSALSTETVVAAPVVEDVDGIPPDGSPGSTHPDLNIPGNGQPIEFAHHAGNDEQTGDEVQVDTKSPSQMNKEELIAHAIKYFQA